MAHHDDRNGDDLGLLLLNGTVAGLAASVALDRLDWFMWNRLSPETRQRTRSVRPEGLDPGHVVARKIARAMDTDIEPKGRDNQHPAGSPFTSPSAWRRRWPMRRCATGRPR